MTRTNTYESIDREMSSWVVTCKKNTTRFFLTDEDLPTDIPTRAKRFRYEDQAEVAARKANHDPAWWGFSWSAMSVPEMLRSMEERVSADEDDPNAYEASEHWDGDERK